jgi:hypothetical protein
MLSKKRSPQTEELTVHMLLTALPNIQIQHSQIPLDWWSASRWVLSASDGQNLTEDIDEMTEGMVTIMAVFAQIEKSGSWKNWRLRGTGDLINGGSG